MHLSVTLEVVELGSWMNSLPRAATSALDHPCSDSYVRKTLVPYLGHGYLRSVLRAVEHTTCIPTFPLSPGRGERCKDAAPLIKAGGRVCSLGPSLRHTMRQVALSSFMDEESEVKGG